MKIDGFRELRRDLKRATPEVNKALTFEMRRVANMVASDARGLAPKLTGRLAASLKGSATQRRATVRSTLPYAGPIHWGWPKRNIKPQPFIQQTVERGGDRYADEVFDALDRALSRTGWK